MNLAAPTPLVEVMSWYRERLVAAGWGRSTETREGIQYLRHVGRRDHICTVQATPGGDGTIKGYAVQYFMT